MEQPVLRYRSSASPSPALELQVPIVIFESNERQTTSTSLALADFESHRWFIGKPEQYRTFRVHSATLFALVPKKFTLYKKR